MVDHRQSLLATTPAQLRTILSACSISARRTSSARVTGRPSTLNTRPIPWPEPSWAVTLTATDMAAANTAPANSDRMYSLRIISPLPTCGGPHVSGLADRIQFTVAGVTRLACIRKTRDFRTPSAESGLVIPSNTNRDHMESGPNDGVSHRVPRRRLSDQVIFQGGALTISINR